jgi:hypothetical protein
MLVLALLTGAASLFNYFCWSNYELPAELRIVSITVQFALTVITVMSAIRYRGKRLRASYNKAGYKIFTFPFAIIFGSVLANLAILAILVLRMTGIMQSLYSQSI